MDYWSLTRAQRALYDDTVTGTHHRRVELEILTLNGRLVRSLENTFLGGQVDGDASRTPADILSCTLFDDDYVLDWQNGEHRQYMARIVDSRFIPDIGDDGEWVEAVVFTGPLWDFERNGAQVSLGAQSIERLAMGSVRHVFSRPRKSRATAVITDLLTAAGAVASGLLIPKLKATLPERVTVGVGRKDKNKDDKRRPKKRQMFRSASEDTYFGEASRIAEALDRLLFADTRGRFVLRAHPTRPSAKLSNRDLVAPVSVKRSVEGDGVNTWEILGANPKGPKKQIRAEVGLPARDPLSAQSLAWHGKPHELIETVENQHLKTHKQARAFGRRLRDRAIGSRVDLEAHIIPSKPWLQSYQLVAAPTEAGHVRLRAARRTLPLGPGADPQVIGANRRSG